jgi:hypothetical protein
VGYQHLDPQYLIRVEQRHALEIVPRFRISPDSDTRALPFLTKAFASRSKNGQNYQYKLITNMETAYKNERAVLGSTASWESRVSSIHIIRVFADASIS